jgi:hypothetical protein
MAMLLQRDEAVLRSEYAVVVEGQGHRLETRQAGVLYLTTHRCVFEIHRSRGVLRGRDPVIVLDAPLVGLTNVSVRRPTLGKPRLVLEIGNLRGAFDVMDPDDWFRAIATARQSVPAPGSPAVVHTIERQVVKVRCRFCGTLSDEREGRCAVCGAPL